MSLLAKRKDTNDAILKNRFIKQQLQEEGKDIKTEQTSLMARRGFQSPEFFSARSMSVSDNALKYDHLAKHRFVDMRRRNTKTGKKNKKNHPIHNRILFGHANNVVTRLSFGFTDAVIAQMQTMEQKINTKTS